MTKEEAGKEFGVSQRAVSGWLAGSIPRRRILEEIAARFRVDLEVLTDNTKNLPAEYKIHNNLSGLDFDRLSDYLKFFDYLEEKKVLEAIDIAFKTNDIDIANVLIGRLAQRKK